MLTLKRGAAMLRSEIAEALWPASDPAKQLVNLRQALVHVREAVGDDGLVTASRDICRLAIHEVNCPDLESIDQHEPIYGAVLPEMTESWFDDFRPGPFGSSKGSHATAMAWEREHAAAASLLDVLDWSLLYRPRATLEITRAAPELAQGAAPARMVSIIDACLAVTKASDPLYGWGIYQRGVAIGMMGETLRGIEQLSVARDHAIHHRDAALIIESSFYLSGYRLVVGERAEAVTCLAEAQELAGGALTATSRIRLRHGLGLALVHSGQGTRGLQELRKACEMCGEHAAPLERAYVYANSAWLEATCGEPSRAASLVEKLEKMEAAKAWRIALTSMLASASLALIDGNETRTKEVAERVLATSERYSAPGFTIYAHEILARLADKQCDPMEARRQLEASERLRKSAGLQYTAWDRHRLKPLDYLCA